MDSKVVNRLKVGFWSSGILFLWTASAFFLMEVLSNKPAASSTPTLGDLATIFFGAASLALIVFSLLIAVAALIQWQSLKGEISHATQAAEATLEKVAKATEENEERVNSLEARMKKRTDEIEKELRGRVDSVMGAMIGTAHSDPTAPVQNEDDKDYILEAIHYSKRAYDRLKEIDNNGRYVALNSIVFFSCLLGDNPRRALLLEQGRELRDVARKYEGRATAAPYLLTFCRAACTYSSNREELEEALVIAQELQDLTLTKLQKKEATSLVASLSKKLAELGASSG